VNGFALSASNRFYVGEFVQFGDGTTGTVEKLGWTEIILRGSDDLVISVPNTQLAGQRVSNLSRNKMCQVKQKLRFHYQDIDKIPDLCEGIKRHIKESCPELISDGSRPFRVFWTDYQDNYLEVSVDCHFQLKPIGDPYWSNRQQVLVAINEAVKEKSISFAVFVVPRLEVPEMK
jgi:small-conductance mechanosensitive channel